MFRRVEFNRALLNANLSLVYQGMQGDPGQDAGLGPPGPKVT